MEWPLIIRVNFDGAPENVSLELTLSVVRENITLGSSHYVVSRPAEGPDWVFLSFSQTLPAVPQTLKVVIELDGMSRFTFSFDVFPRGSCRYFIVSYRNPGTGPSQRIGWDVDSHLVGC